MTISSVASTASLRTPSSCERARDHGRGKPLAEARNRIERARREFAQQRRAFAEALAFGENFGHRARQICARRSVDLNQRCQRRLMLLAQRVEKRFGRRRGRPLRTAWPLRSSLLVTPLIAETTATTGPSREASFTICATRAMQDASPTDVPPNFITRNGLLMFGFCSIPGCTCKIRRGAI